LAASALVVLESRSGIKAASRRLGKPLIAWDATFAANDSPFVDAILPGALCYVN
jgi:hypothetical protein